MRDIYYTYVLYSTASDKIYIGQTTDLKKRLEAHNSGKSSYTKSYIPWELVYFEEFTTRSQAMKKEKELKSHRGREYIRNKILSVRVRQMPD
jgi:putative endonuclease